MYTHENLSDKSGSLSSALLSNSDIITAVTEDSTSFAEMQAYIRNLIIKINDKPIDKKSPATKKFLLALNKQYSKAGISLLVYNTLLAGDNMAVIK